MEPSSSNKGFFQAQPVLKNQLYDDISIQRTVKLNNPRVFLPPSVFQAAESDLSQLGEDVLSDTIFNHVTDAERNLPYLRGNGRDAFGKPKSELVVTEGWRKLQDFGIEKGVVAFNYDSDYAEYTRAIQCLRLHIWEASCANTLCPAAMQDGAARLLQLHLAGNTLEPTQKRVLQNAFYRLTSRDPTRAWTSGQWMTERSGGSDVSQTETLATFAPFPANEDTPLADVEDEIPLGPWVINGFKWFSSATDASMTILLAKTGPGKGLSAFFAPMRRYNPSIVSATGKRGGTELNGVNIQRLKNKLGTQSLPTAELELKGMRGWMIGKEGKGIQEISTILAITRVHSTISSLGYLGRGLAIAKSYALVREVGAGRGKRIPLWKNPLHMRTLANITGEYHAMMLLTFYTAYLLGLDETDGRPRPTVQDMALSALSPPRKHVAPLLRVLTSILKSYCCERTVPLLFGCMEALGGVGYLVNAETEHANVARIFRDACVLPIWEGTTDVLASDTLRALKHPVAGIQSLDGLGWFVESAVRELSASADARLIGEEWEKVRTRIVSQDQESLLVEARDITFRIAEILIAALLLTDVKVNNGPEVQTLAQRVLQKQGFVSSDVRVAGGLDIDQAIVYGKGGPDMQKEKSKL